MPNMDGRGPKGNGPMTGRCGGYCCGERKSAFGSMFRCKILNFLNNRSRCLDFTEKELSEALERVRKEKASLLKKESDEE